MPEDPAELAALLAGPHARRSVLPTRAAGWGRSVLSGRPLGRVGAPAAVPNREAPTREQEAPPADVRCKWSRSKC